MCNKSIVDGESPVKFCKLALYKNVTRITIQQWVLVVIVDCSSYSFFLALSHIWLQHCQHTDFKVIQIGTIFNH